MLPEAGRTELAGISPASCQIQAHAVHGRLGVVAELPGHEAGAAADAELSHGPPHCLRHRIADRGIRSLKPGRNGGSRLVRVAVDAKHPDQGQGVLPCCSSTRVTMVRSCSPSP